MPDALRVAIIPEPTDYFRRAIKDGGADLVGLNEDPQALVADFTAKRTPLKPILDENPGIEWVQLPSAGIEAFADALAAHPHLTWTSAKGAYAPPVAEHALALTLALLRDLPERARATTWGPNTGTSLNGLTVLIVGGGGIGVEALRLFKTFDTTVNIVRRRNIDIPGADLTTTTDRMPALLADADVVLVAAALTDSTAKLIGAAELDSMKPSAVLVNIARGGLIDTDALVEALAAGRIAAAALDVTAPEPLPDGHPLWNEPRALITPHSADTFEMVVPLICARLERNLRHRAAGEPLEGLVDPAAGY